MATLEEDIATIVNTIDPSIEIRDVQADDGQSGWISEVKCVTINLLGYSRQGVDERRYTAEGEDLRERIYGNRTLRVQFTCETNRQTFEQTALEVADDLIAGLTRTDIEEILSTHELGVPVCTPARQTNYLDAHGDQRSAAVFEAQFPASRRHAAGLVVTIKEIAVTGSDGVNVDVGPV